jgi:hypothetical protein
VPIVADEDAEVIAVEGQREAVGRAEGGEQGRVAVQVLRGAEVEREAGAGGVVDGPTEGQRRAARFGRPGRATQR